MPVTQWHLNFNFTCHSMCLAGVTSIAGIYEYLENTVVPSVAARNVTLIDARCTSDGRHANPVLYLVVEAF